MIDIVTFPKAGGLRLTKWIPNLQSSNENTRYKKMGVAVHYFFFSIFLWAVTWGHSWTTMMWLRVWIRLWLCGSGIRRSQAIQPRGGSMSRRNLPPISTRKLTRKEWWRWKGKLRTPITWQQWVHILKTRNWSFRNTGCLPCLEIVFRHFLLLT